MQSPLGRRRWVGNLRSVLFAAVVLPCLSHAQSPGCGQRLVTQWSSVGDLSFSLQLGPDGERELWLHYTGPVESDVGRVWPMSAKLASKQVAVVIGKQSVPADDGGATLPAEGVNRGAVKLPTLRVGKYELAIRKGQMIARYALEVKEGQLKVRALQNVAGLLIAAEVWRELPPEQKLVVARCSGDERACETAFSSQLIADARLEDGGWLNAPWIPDGCVLREPEGGLPPMPDGSVLSFTPITR